MKWYWPKLTDLKEAEQAAHQGGGVCFAIAVFTAIVAGMSLWLDRPVLGIQAGALVDAGVFAIAGWRIWRLSRIWAVLAFLFYITEWVYKLEVASGSIPPAAGYIGVFLILILISGVRGTFTYHALKKKESMASFSATVGRGQ